MWKTPKNPEPAPLKPRFSFPACLHLSVRPNAMRQCFVVKMPPKNASLAHKQMW
jgi:hypothetical protein